MSRKSYDPFQLWRLGYDMSIMLTEAQMVIWMRTLGMLGGWSVAPSENKRMVSEKTDAWSRSARNMSNAILAGQTPIAAMSAGLAPIRKKTRSNAYRLGRRGPKIK